MKKSFTVSIGCVMCVALILLSGCNTVKGVGRDTAAVGHEVSRVAS